MFRVIGRLRLIRCVRFVTLSIRLLLFPLCITFYHYSKCLNTYFYADQMTEYTLAQNISPSAKFLKATIYRLPLPLTFLVNNLREFNTEICTLVHYIA